MGLWQSLELKKQNNNNKKKQASFIEKSDLVSYNVLWKKSILNLKDLSLQRKTKHK